MKTILVTGANGFVGSHILEALMRRKGIRVIAACRDGYKLIDGFTGEVQEGDLRDGAYLGRLVEGVDVVCHAAAWTSLWGHARESRTLYYEPTIRLLDKVLASGVSRFINVSTTSAAAPRASANPASRGISRSFWPHLSNVVAIEDYMRAHAGGCTMVNLRLGVFAGRRYGLGVLPILLPRLKTHLVPWVAGGRTSLPLIDGRDVGEAFALAALQDGLSGYEAFNIVGPETPTVRQVLAFIHAEFGFPLPHFNVPFPLAYAFAWCMETLDPLVPWEPLVTRSIVHLLEEVDATNEIAARRLGYRPQVHWQEAVRTQISEIRRPGAAKMKMARPVT